MVGMRGTGSHTVIAKEIFVPAHRALPTEVLAKGRSPRTNRDEFVYRESFAPTAIIAVAAPVLGLAQAALELTLERIRRAISRSPTASMTMCARRRACSSSLPRRRP